MSTVVKTLVLATLVTQVAYAQAPPVDPAGAPTGQPPAPEPAPQVDVTVPQRSTLTPTDMLVQAEGYRKEMQGTKDRIGVLLTDANQARDVIRVTCLNDKDDQADVNLTIADEALPILREAAKLNQQGTGLHEYTRISIVNQKMQVVAAEAEGCAGDDLAFVGTTQVAVVVSRELRKDDVTSLGGTSFSASRQLERPVSFSPFRSATN
jgi:hypothetical protein